MLSVFYSNVPPRHGGAGDYLEYLLSHKKYDEVITPELGSRFWKITIIPKLLKVYFLVLFYNVEITLYHPQTLGYLNCYFLLNFSKRTNIYFVDTAFFCKSSYNVYKKNNCVRCLHQFQPSAVCRFSPAPSNNFSYGLFLTKCSEMHKEIMFIVQTQGYKRLLQEKYGAQTQVNIEKMITKDLLMDPVVHMPALKYDVAFHGSCIVEKGYEYFMALVEHNKGLSFFAPSAPSKASQFIKNLNMMDVRWAYGLRAELSCAKLIICPSIWTAPIEASVIKSMLLKKAVAVMNTNTIIEEFPINTFIVLTGDIEADSNTISRILSSDELLSEYATNAFNQASNYIRK